MNEIENEGIFTNRDEVVDGMREAAKAVGANPDMVAPAPDDDGTRYLARKNCKKCFGRGVLTFVPSPQKQKIFSKNFSPRGYRAKARGRHASKPRRRAIFGIAPPNEDMNWLWDDREIPNEDKKRWTTYSRGTSRPEPYHYKQEAQRQILCGCVRREQLV